MSEDIKFNLIIPTRERADTLYHCLRTITTQDYENLNIIISDNCSQDNTKEVVTSFRDKRITYINTGSRLSMAHNWEFALGHVENGWITFLGDDDGLCLGALQLLNKLIKEYKVETISSHSAYFNWPNHFENSYIGTLNIPLSTSVKLKDSETELRRALSGYIPHTKLPWLYHGGVASISLINRLRNKNGQFFCSQIPDVYSAIALASGTTKYLYLDFPLAINGASRHSNGNAWMRSKSGTFEQPALKFKSEDNIPFHESLILGKSEQIVMYECYLQSWHIHNVKLNISLNDQLDIAYKAAPKYVLKEIKEDCRMIAEKNGIEYKAKNSRWFFKLVNVPAALINRFFSFIVKPVDVNVQNIYDASLYTSFISKFIENNFVGIKFIFLTANFIRRGYEKFKALFLVEYRDYLHQKNNKTKV